MLASGTGSSVAESPPSCRYKGSPAAPAAACAAASDTARIAFAPSRALFGVPSSAIRAASSAPRSAASMPLIAALISPLTAPTAPCTPRPRYRASPSRRSTASCDPVLAPDGTAARPKPPPASTTSASTVGFPRESRISRARIETISVSGMSRSARRIAPSPAQSRLAGARVSPIVDVPQVGVGQVCVHLRR